MSDQFNSAIDRVGADTGLGSWMGRVYGMMTGGLCVTGLAAWVAAHSPAFLHAFYTMQGNEITGMSGLGWLIMIAPVGLVFMMSFGMERLSAPAMHAVYWLYAALAGLCLSVIFLAYTDASIATACFVTAGMFGGLSFYGRTTEGDLSGFSSFLFAGLIGLILASFVNLFLHSTGMQFALSVIGVLVFAGLTAVDTQKLKALYLENEGDNAAILGALTLYLDVINIFVNLLFLMGRKK